MIYLITTYLSISRIINYITKLKINHAELVLLTTTRSKSLSWTFHTRWINYALLTSSNLLNLYRTELLVAGMNDFSRSTVFHSGLFPSRRLRTTNSTIAPRTRNVSTTYTRCTTTQRGDCHLVARSVLSRARRVSFIA